MYKISLLQRQFQYLTKRYQQARFACFITMTPNAQERLKKIVEEYADSNKGLRINVVSGGCHGFKYEFSLDSAAKDDTKVVLHNGATLLIDKFTQPFIKNCVIDYKDTLMDSHFIVTENSAAQYTCGCKSSFEINEESC